MSISQRETTRRLGCPLLWVALLAFVTGGCKQSSHEDRRTYSFDPRLGRCIEGTTEGRNRDAVSECGQVANIDMAGRDFRGANLRGMHFDNVNLQGADFSGADLYYATFSGSNLKDATFNDANAVAFFDSSPMQGADLRGASFFDYAPRSRKNTASFTNIDFSQATIDSQTIIDTKLSDAIGTQGMVYDGAENPPTSIESVGIELSFKGENALSPEQRARLAQDFARFAEIELNPRQGWFEKIFAGSTMAHVYDYLRPRLNFFIAREPNSGDKVIAGNLGPSFWGTEVHKLRNWIPNPATRDVNERAVPLDSPRRGMIHVGLEYDNLKMPQIRRLATLVHEARHSDCPVKPTVAQLETYAATGQYGDAICNFPHTICPAGHALEGKEACDQLPWGAYGTAGVFLDRLAEECVNCSEEERQMALIFAKETKSRVIVLDDMLSGRLGDPDMRSIE